MIAHPKRSESYRDRAWVFPLAALALTGIGLSACSGAPGPALHAQANRMSPSLEAVCAPDRCLPATPRAVASAPLPALHARVDSARDFERLELAMAVTGKAAPAGAPASGQRDFARLQLARAGTFGAADESGTFGIADETGSGRDLGQDDLGQDGRADDALLAYRVVPRAELNAQRDFARLQLAKAPLAESRPQAPVEPAADRLQLSSAAVGAEELASHRGGFITVDGIQVDFAFQQISTINDLQQITSRITLADMIAGNPGTVTVGGITTSGTGSIDIVGADGGVTHITHNVLPSSINTIFANTTNGIDASNTVDLVIDIVGIDTVRIGHRVGQRPMNMELRNALVHSIGN